MDGPNGNNLPHVRPNLSWSDDVVEEVVGLYLSHGPLDPELDSHWGLLYCDTLMRSRELKPDRVKL